MTVPRAHQMAQGTSCRSAGDLVEPIHILFGGYQPPTSVHTKAADAEVLRHLYPSQNEVIFLTPTERVLFVKAVTPLVDEQRQVLGNEVLRYVS